MTFGILALGFPVSQVLQVFQPLGAHSLTFFTILMHSLGDVWHPGYVLQVLQPLVAHRLTFFSILMHSLGDRLASWLWGSLFRRLVPCFAGFAAFGGPQSHFLPYLNAFLR